MHYQLFQLTEKLLLCYLNTLDSKTKQHERVSCYLVYPLLVTSAESISNACEINHASSPQKTVFPLVITVLVLPFFEFEDQDKC